MKAFWILAVLVVGFSGAAVAQSGSGPSVPDGEGTTAPGPIAAITSLRAILTPHALATFTSTGAPDTGDSAVRGRWAIGSPLAIASWTAARQAPRPALRRINRRFLPIPLVAWRGRFDLAGTSGSIAVNPSIVIGQRLTAMPEVIRGGRTLGFAVEMKIRFDAPVAPAASARQTDTTTAIVSRLRGLLDTNGR